MSESLQSIKQGLAEAITFARGQTTGAIVHEFAPLDIKVTVWGLNDDEDGQSSPSWRDHQGLVARSDGCVWRLAP
jgi:hypothetical protein